MKEVGNILKLRDVVFPVATVFNQQRKNVIEFATSVSRIEFGEFPEDGAPCGGFLWAVLYSRDLLATASHLKGKIKSLNYIYWIILLIYYL